jgi:hypothetical protein
MKFRLESLKGRDHPEKLHVTERTILQQNLKEI